MYMGIMKGGLDIMVYKLLMINMDGALLSSKGKLHTHTRESIEYVAKKGVEVALMTSENYDYTQRTGKALRCNPHIIAHQGGFILENLHNPIFVKRIPENTTLDIIRFLEKLSGHIRLIHEDMTIGNRMDLPTPLFARIKWTPGETNIYAQQFVDSLDEYLRTHPMSPLQIDIYIDKKQDRIDAKSGLEAMFENVMIQESHPNKLVILPEQVTKEKAFNYLLKNRGIAANEVVLIGSDQDESELVRNVGLGVAVANADAAVKRSAKWITRSNDELGVAYLIKEVFRRQHPIGFLKKMNIKTD
ncbi:HAD hydrolase family protein [Pradoshia sp. D12]|nr:HAD hydrolase family protein [Pradoshia sp. D12]TPF72266.1 haloacid dehalogenase [Bacillus sp. D12]